MECTRPRRAPLHALTTWPPCSTAYCGGSGVAGVAGVSVMAAALLVSCERPAAANDCTLEAGGVATAPARRPRGVMLRGTGDSACSVSIARRRRPGRRGRLELQLVALQRRGTRPARHLFDHAGRRRLDDRKAHGVLQSGLYAPLSLRNAPGRHAAGLSRGTTQRSRRFEHDLPGFCAGVPAYVVVRFCERLPIFHAREPTRPRRDGRARAKCGNRRLAVDPNERTADDGNGAPVTGAVHRLARS